MPQGSLVSRLLYDWYINDLISLLSSQFDTKNTFAYAVDVALIYMEHLTLLIRRRELQLNGEEIEGILFVLNYKYLGVPLDTALTLKHLYEHLKFKIKKFNQRIGLILRRVVGTATKLNLWQTYARCHFEYFSPAIAICKKVAKV